LLEACAARFGRERLEILLGRGFLLGQAVDQWHSRGIWVISRADTGYPRRLKSRLREDAPAILYGCGEVGLLDAGGLAVVGSRHVDEELVCYTKRLGAMAAEAGTAVVSGAARGIDSSAMSGALDSGGRVIGVMADSLGRAALAKGNREALREGRLVMISAFDPGAGFNVGHAMQRNKMIYALADAGLVVTSDFQKGGTWAGAIEQLQKYHFGPVFVRNGEAVGKGNAALIQHGGRPWPEPRNGEELLVALTGAKEAKAQEPQQDYLGLRLCEEPAPYKTGKVALEPPPSDAIAATSVDRTPAVQLIESVRSILSDVLTKPMTEQEVAELLDVSKAQAKSWLVRLVKSGSLEKLNKPVRYQAVGASWRLF
jgi:predicted Rossmann fold nucleotide-binding protein DprA/Smf involved in DNA uptake